MLCLSLLYYGYALVMWYVFFMVPKSLGQVSNLDVSRLDIAAGRESEIMRLEDEEDNLKTVVRELDHDREFLKNQARKGSDVSRNSAAPMFAPQHQRSD